jgi:hypothetical protein
VTSARASVEDDRHKRMRNYLVAMGLRTVSFPIAIWAFVTDHLVIGWIFVTAAVLIPSVAVAVANAVDRRSTSTSPPPSSPVQGLAAAAGGPEAGGTAAGGPSSPSTLVLGTVVSSRDTPYPAAADEPAHDGPDRAAS